MSALSSSSDDSSNNCARATEVPGYGCRSFSVKVSVQVASSSSPLSLATVAMFSSCTSLVGGNGQDSVKVSSSSSPLSQNNQLPYNWAVSALSSSSDDSSNNCARATEVPGDGCRSFSVKVSVQVASSSSPLSLAAVAMFSSCTLYPPWSVLLCRSLV